jgi:hypothetical protein
MLDREKKQKDYICFVYGMGRIVRKQDYSIHDDIPDLLVRHENKKVITFKPQNLNVYHLCMQIC